MTSRSIIWFGLGDADRGEHRRVARSCPCAGHMTRVASSSRAISSLKGSITTTVALRQFRLSIQPRMAATLHTSPGGITVATPQRERKRADHWQNNSGTKFENPWPSFGPASHSFRPFGHPAHQRIGRFHHELWHLSQGMSRSSRSWSIA